MEEIELVIKINEDTYNHFVSNEYSRADVIAMHTAIVNGIPHETVTEFADRCRECGAKYNKLLKQEPKTGHCKDCKYFEYDSAVKVNGIPFIVAHEICSRWGDGCKTREDGYCFLFELKESEIEEEE